jgi:hypothetical protein
MQDRLSKLVTIFGDLDFRGAGPRATTYVLTQVSPMC